MEDTRGKSTAARSGARSNQSTGAFGEEVAARRLQDQGLEILDRNWHCRWGEIDIVAVERIDGQRRLVFCEVKTRTGRGYGSPLESITFAKMQRLRRLAGHWLEAHGGRSDRSPGSRRSEWSDIRIDAIGVVLDFKGAAEPEITHVRAVG